MKKGVKFILALFMATSLLLMLAACDLGGSNGNTNKNNKDEKSVKTEEKVKLETAMDNYKEKDAKKSTLKTEVSFTMYMALTNDGDVVERTFSLGAELDRVTDGEKNYAEGKVKPKEVPDNVKSLLQKIVSEVQNTSSGLGFLGIGKKTAQQAQDALPYIEMLQSFLNREIDLSAKMGINDSTINLKTEMEKHVSNKPVTTDSAWYYTSGASLSEFLGINVETDMAVKLLTTPVMGNRQFNGTDSESAHVSTTGEAKYDFTFAQKAVTAYVTSYVGELLNKIGTIETSEQRKAVESAVKTVAGWIRPEQYEFKATVGTDKLPVETNATIGVVIDVPRVELVAVLEDLQDAGILEENVADTISGVAWLLSSYARNAKNEKQHFGFRIAVNTKESFKYDASSCNMSKLDPDLFIDESVQAEGRVSVTDALGVVAEEAVNALIENYVEASVETLEEVDLQTIVTDVLAKLDFSGKVTVNDVKVAVELTLSEHGIRLKGKAQAGDEDEQTPPEENDEGSDEEATEAGTEE